ncbi:MAG: hypothetical protein HYX94_12315 [Chloroflexi bacterium]|nr:hypothetical protein [Chloroflexota bacterium]
MEINDLVLTGVRWLHALAGAAWVGGGLFYLLVLQPSLEEVEDQSSLSSLKQGVAGEFKEVVGMCVVGLIITGAVLTFDRLAHGNVGNLYVAILALKVAGAGGMFALTWAMGRRRPVIKTREGATIGGEPIEPLPAFLRRLISPSQLILVLGVLVFFLAAMLQVLFEKR